ncbi:Non-heme chloroperoxidase [Marinibacterium anthonyi]|nr:Non-heme chloroperoxidase [Marinibacterium anthonyi]
MSWNPTQTPDCPDALPESLDSIDTLIIPRTRDLGGFVVRRALPAPKRQMVGPFIFFDQMGPAEFLTGGGIDVRPHPHIGLATVTYLYKGEFHHRDSTGADQMVYPGEVNWMIAGGGVIHSERTSEDLKAITVPVLVLHGDDDQIVPIADSALKAIDLLANGTLKTYPGFPHGMLTVNADTLNADLLAFVEA